MKDAVSQQLRWQLFKLIDRLTRLGKPPRPIAATPQTARSASPKIWLFISTIGEMNAISGFLDALAALIPPQHWLIISDRQIYRQAYLQRFPQAQVVEISDDPREAQAMAAVCPPSLLLVAEIPLHPSDAPCRLPYAWLAAARRHAAPCVLVNGWPYGYPPSCRADALERALLGEAWLQAFDLLAVQDQAAADFVLARGARPECVAITGNMKFDALAAAQPARPGDGSLARWLAQGPTVIAGSVTDAAEQALVLEAFVALRQQRADAQLLLAPRHPENPQVMAHIAAQCQNYGLDYRCRSSQHDADPSPQPPCLVLDSMGELRTAFALGACAHIGRDHNLLEPLCAGLAVTALPDWNPTYPSYPVFKLLEHSGDIALHDDAAGLAFGWLAAMQQDASAGSRVAELHARHGGATARSWQLALPFVERASQRLAQAAGAA